MRALYIVAADVNGDSNLDLLVPDGCMAGGNDCYGGVEVLLGNRDGTFQPARSYSSGGYYSSSVAVGDVNGDNKADLLVTHWCTELYCWYGGVVGVLLGNGDGTFQPAQAYSSGGSYADSIAMRDINGDGKPDLVVAHRYWFGIGVLLGNGDGTFQPARSYGSGGDEANSVVVVDVNADNKPDLLVTNQYGNNNLRRGSVGLLLGIGDGTFQPPQSHYSGGKLASSIVVKDVNEDGVADLLVANKCMAEGCGHGGVASVLLGNGDGTFQPPQGYAAGGAQTNFITIGDVDGDGKPDLLVSNAGSNNKKGVGVLRGSGDGTFGSAQTYDSGGDGADTIAVADVNKDGKADLLVANQCYDRCGYGGVVSVLLGRFGTTTTFNSSLNPSVYGQSVTLAATVSSGGPNAPTGTVTFRNGAKLIGKATLGGGVAMLTTKTLPAGTGSITATYNGNPESIDSTSAPLTQVVSTASSTTTIKSSLNPSAQGQPVTFTARVTSPTTRAAGAVTFTAANTTLGTVTLKGGTASITTSALPHGSNSITATYDGTANIVGSAASLTQTVN